MNYHNITHDDMLNGDGLRTVLWVSGCNHYCFNCQNQFTWDPNQGIEFDGKAMTEIFEWCDKDYCSGLTLSGGDPMYPGNRDYILWICLKFRDRYKDSKTIWMYTGYEFEDIRRSPVMDLIDVVVVGEYIDKLRNVNYQWAGSENQRVYRKKDSKWTMDPQAWAGKVEGYSCDGDE